MNGYTVRSVTFLLQLCLIPNIMNKIVGLKTAFYVLVRSFMIVFDLFVLIYDFSAVKMVFYLKTLP